MVDVAFLPVMVGHGGVANVQRPSGQHGLAVEPGQHAGGQVRNALAVNPPLECTRDEAIARFYGEWILFQILDEDEYHTPTRGLVFAHSPDRGAISEVLATLPVRTKDQPYQPYYTFFGGSSLAGSSS